MDAMTRRQQHAAQLMYPDVVRMIMKQVREFCLQHGCNLEDMLSAANMGYLEACQSYDRTKAQFTTHVHHHVWFAMQNELRKQQVERRCLQTYRTRKRAEDHNDKTGWLGDFLSTLNSDASYIVWLAINAPTEVLQVAAGHTDPRRWGGTLRVHLRSVCAGYGWSKQRIAEAMAEVAEALASQ